MDNTEETLSRYSAEADVGVSFGGLFSALTVFFTGLLISNYNSFSEYVRVPILFLVISTFGFVYATLIYANATAKLKSTELKSCEKAIRTADILSEFMGVYTLLISIPLVIPVVTDDVFLIYSVFISDVVGLIIYHLSSFDIVQEYYPRAHFFIVAVIIALMVALMFFLMNNNQLFLQLSVVATVLFLITISILCIRKIKSC